RYRDVIAAVGLDPEADFLEARPAELDINGYVLVALEPAGVHLGDNGCRLPRGQGFLEGPGGHAATGYADGADGDGHAGVVGQTKGVDEEWTFRHGAEIAADTFEHGVGPRSRQGGTSRTQAHHHDHRIPQHGDPSLLSGTPVPAGGHIPPK